MPFQRNIDRVIGSELLIQNDDGDAVASINSEGVGTFQSVSVVNDLSIGGLDLITGIIDPLPKGILAWGQWLGETTINTTTEIGIMEIQLAVEANRITTMTFDASFYSTVADDNIVFRIRYTTNGTAPTTSSTVLMEKYFTGPRASIAQDAHWEQSDLWGASPITLRLLLTVGRAVGTGTVNMFGNVIRRTEIRIRDEGTALLPTDVAPAAAPVSIYQKDYFATWSRSYNGSNAANSFGGATRVYQGDIGDSNGNRRSMIGFDWSTIQSDLSGATVNGCWITLYFQHWYYNAGGTAVIGTHSSTAGSGPATWSGTANRVQSGGWPKPGLRQVSLGTGIGDEFRTGVSRGIVLGPGPSSALTYYGYASGFGASNPPKLTINYTK